MSEFIKAMGNALERALKSLLSEKHLYQSVEVDTSFFKQLAKATCVYEPSPHGSFRIPESRLIEMFNQTALQGWLPKCDGNPVSIENTKGKLLYHFRSANDQYVLR